ncbi:MAG: ferritin-like domain-containing protein [Pyrinomonadaceae bacterium]|nr:ferritin-like domain-containing protein [Pyrinomonadaceae bacterium]MDQ3585861.1 ferritin-like domain-containing protein [Acidobacteriota bacterium]
MSTQFDSSIITDTIEKNARDNHDRRRFLRNAGIAGIAAALAATPLAEMTAAAQSGTVTDANILNFALNLEYLEAEFYVRAAFGRGLADSDTTGTGTRGDVAGGRQVTFATEAIRQYAVEIANDEEAHVRFLRTALASAAVARPAIDINMSFTAAARAAGLIGGNDVFDAYANENNFLLAAFIFEDVGVTAYKGAARFIQNRDFLEAAAGLLAVEAYHAANIRTVLFARGLSTATRQISDLRDSVDGADDRDQGVVLNGMGNITPTDANALAFSRTPRQVLNIVYLAENANSGGFFPAGVNGTVPIV